MTLTSPVSGYLKPHDSMAFSCTIAHIQIAIVKNHYGNFDLILNGGYRPKRIKRLNVKMSGKYVIKTSQSVFDLIDDYIDLVCEVANHFRFRRAGFYYFVEDYEPCNKTTMELLK